MVMRKGNKWGIKIIIIIIKFIKTLIEFRTKTKECRKSF